MQERLSLRVHEVDVGLVLHKGLGEGLLPAGQRNVQGEVISVVKTVDSHRKLEGMIGDRPILIQMQVML